MSLNAVVVHQRRQTFEVLKAENFRVLQAGDGIEAIRKVIRYSPDVLIMKVDTPVLNGLSVVQILEILEMDVPVIFSASIERFRERALKYKSVLAYLNVSELSEKLPGFLAKACQIQERVRNNKTFQFRQNEWSDLLGISERKKILIVEDSSTFRRTALSILDPLDQFELYSAPNGMEGLLKALLIKPDLIISDIEMPVLNGFIMSQIFFILNKPYPIVFLTGHDSDVNRQKAQIIESVIGFMGKGILKEPHRFIEEINSFIRVSEGLESQIKTRFDLGSPHDLDKTGSKHGVLQGGKDFKPLEHHIKDFETRHKQGLGGLYK